LRIISKSKQQDQLVTGDFLTREKVGMKAEGKKAKRVKGKGKKGKG
jgi:hypothetical protein